MEPGAESFTSDLYTAFSAQFPGLATLATFSARLQDFLDASYPGQVSKRRVRKPGEGNPTSLLVGIRLRDEPGILRLPSCIS